MKPLNVHLSELERWKYQHLDQQQLAMCPPRLPTLVAVYLASSLCIFCMCTEEFLNLFFEFWS